MPDSAASNVISVGPPAAPTSLTASQATPTSNVVVTFIDGSANETGFTIQRSVNGAAFAPKATATSRTGTGSTVTYTDPRTTFPTPPGTPWTVNYRVRADNPMGSSAWVTLAAPITVQ
jgi:hypothetical protein